MIDLTGPGIAAMCGPAKSGKYEATIADVSSSVAPGGGKVLHLTWKCAGVKAPITEELLVSVVGHPLAPALQRLADILQSNGRPLQFEHMGAAMKALVGCAATLAITVDRWSGNHSIVVYTRGDEPAAQPPLQHAK